MPGPLTQDRHMAFGQGCGLLVPICSVTLPNSPQPHRALLLHMKNVCFCLPTSQLPEGECLCLVLAGEAARCDGADVSLNLGKVLVQI